MASVALPEVARAPRREWLVFLRRLASFLAYAQVRENHP